MIDSILDKQTETSY